MDVLKDWLKEIKWQFEIPAYLEVKELLQIACLWIYFYLSFLQHA